MERSEVKFRARDQVLTFTGGIRRYASDTVNYVEAYFELQDNWSGFDVIAAVWNNGSARIATDLDSDGKCRVPQEVLSKKGDVYVNLTGTTSAGNAVTERLTSYPVWVLSVDAKSHIRGSETSELTPSQFEQFVTEVKADADRAETVRDEAEAARDVAVSAKDTAVNAVEGFEDIVDTATATAVQTIQGEGATQVTAIQTEGTTQVASVRTEGSTQVTAVQDKGDEVLDSIPADYTQLSQNVTDLKSELSDETSARILLAGRTTRAESDIDTLETHKVAQPLDEYNQPTNGTSGQSLRTKGDGTTEWADVGLPTDEQTADAVSAWLDEHPEATTTVQDDSLTTAKYKGESVTIDKLVKSLQLKNLISLNNMSFSNPIALPVAKSYVEAVTYLDGKYYAVCRDYTSSPNTTYVAIYDDGLALLSYSYTNSAYGIANNMFNDGERIYIDYDSGYHVSFDASISDDFAVINSAFRHMAYWNDALYGIAINANDVTVYELNYNFDISETLFIVPTVKQGNQSASIIDGILIIPTTKGLFKFIDMKAQTMLAEVPYYSTKEIENFFKDSDGSIKTSGHIYGENGIFNIGSFDNGVDSVEMHYYESDGSIGEHNVVGNHRYGIYKITNGTAMGLPTDNGDLVSLETAKLFLSSDGKVYSYYGSHWRMVGGLTTAYRTETATLDGKTYSNAFRILKVGNVVTVYMTFYRSTVGSALTAPITIGTLPEGYRPPIELLGIVSCRMPLAWPSSVIHPLWLKVGREGDLVLYGSNDVLTNGLVFTGTITFIVTEQV